jgi:biopolymer transport protein ExbD
LYDQAFARLDAIVTRAGGADAIMQDPEQIPQVHIRGDVNAPWRCVAGAIYNVQAAGYPTVGFISNPVAPGI